VFRRLCEAMGRPELADDERFSTHLERGRHQKEIEAIVSQWSATRSAREIDELLNAVGVVCGPVYTIADIFRDPQYQEREMLVDHHDPEIGRFVGPGIVPKLSGTPGAVKWSGPWEPGSHNDEIYQGLLGLSEGELAELRDEGVL
jgi:formyl-CoA transferase